MARGYFVTGTDTGVGKTTFSVALIDALQQRGLKVAAMKPVASGGEWREGRYWNEDVLALSQAANIRADISKINPYAYAPPIAPHIAAAQAGTGIDFDHIVAAHTALANQADIVVVEGAGGLCVPLNEENDIAGLVAALNLPIILVVGMKLGCLNHALLTAEVIAHRGLKWAGWVANILDPDMPVLEENISTLDRLLPTPNLGRLIRMQNDENFTMLWSTAFTFPIA